MLYELTSNKHNAFSKTGDEISILGDSNDFRLAIAPSFSLARKRIFDQRYGDRSDKHNVS